MIDTNSHGKFRIQVFKVSTPILFTHKTIVLSVMRSVKSMQVKEASQKTNPIQFLTTPAFWCNVVSNKHMALLFRCVWK